jgi:hypothetical protein
MTESIKNVLRKLIEGDKSVVGANNRISFTIGELQKLKDKINFSPKEYQRFFRASLQWQEQFMMSFFLRGIIIPEFCFRFGKHIPSLLGEIMDGQQRATTIVLRYLENKFGLPTCAELEFIEIPGCDFTYDCRGKFYKDLPIEVRDYLLDYELSAQVYLDLTPEQAGDIFVNVLNNSTSLNPQEKRQAISSPMSRFVQEKARFKPYPLFETKEKKGNELKWIAKAEHKALDVDKMLAETIYMISSDTYKSKGVGAKALDDFYRTHSRNQKEFNSKHIDNVMTFVNQSMRQVPEAKNFIPLKLLRNYCVMVSDLKKAKVKIDPVDFMRCFIKAVINLKDQKLRSKGMTKTPFEMFMNNSSKFDTNSALDALWKEVSKITFYNIQLDSKRTFTREEVQIAYINQEGICAICETEMPEFGPEIEGDHVLLYKDGNPTTPDNCDAVHGSCNRRKG